MALSAAAECPLSGAFALYRFLIDDSSRTIPAALDLTDVRDGEHLSPLEKRIPDCDGVVLVIAPGLLREGERHPVEITKDCTYTQVHATLRAKQMPIRSLVL